MLFNWGKKLYRKLSKGWQYSCSGLGFACRHERAFQLEAITLAVSLPLAVIISDNLWQFLLLEGSLLFVLIIELINTAIEKTVDNISLEYRELSKVAKDSASAAVFLSLLLALSVWVTAVVSKYS